MFDETNGNQQVSEGQQEVTTAPVEETVNQEPVNPYLSKEETPVMPAGAPAQAPKKNNTAKIVIGVVIAIAVVVIAVLALVFSGVFKNKKQIIGEALKNTFAESGSYISESWNMAQYEGMFEEESYTIDAEAELPEGVGVEMEILHKDTENAYAYADISMAGSSMVEVEYYVDEAQILVAIPNMLDYVFVINRETVEDDIWNLVDIGMLDEETVQQLADALAESKDMEVSEEAAEQFTNDIVTACKNYFEKSKVVNADKKELYVNGEDRECKGYSVVATYEDIAILCEELLAAYENNEQILEMVKTSFVTSSGYDESYFDDSMEELRDGIEEIREDAEREFKVDFYLYDNKVAQIYCEEDSDVIEWNMEGGNFPLENTSIGFYTDDEVVFEISRKGSDEDGEYRAEYAITDEYGSVMAADIRYTKETGEASLELLEDDYSIAFLAGSIEKQDDTALSIDLDAFEVYEEEIMSGNITITEGCDEIIRPEGEELELLLMDEEDWENLIYEIYMSGY